MQSFLYPIPNPDTGMLDASQVALIDFNLRMGDPVMTVMMVRFMLGFSVNTSWVKEMKSPGSCRPMAAFMPIVPRFTDDDGIPTAQSESLPRTRIRIKAVMKVPVTLKDKPWTAHGRCT